MRIDRALGQLDLLGQDERRRILVEWNDTAQYFPDATLASLFEQQVELTPDVVAVASDNCTLSYRELNKEANRLAHFLIGRGVAPEDFVALNMRSSPEMVVALLGISKAGAAYQPLDPDDPPARLEQLLIDSGAAVILTTSELEARLPNRIPCVVVNEQTVTESLQKNPTTNPLNQTALRGKLCPLKRCSNYVAACSDCIRRFNV